MGSKTYGVVLILITNVIDIKQWRVFHYLRLCEEVFITYKRCYVKGGGKVCLKFKYKLIPTFALIQIFGSTSDIFENYCHLQLASDYIFFRLRHYCKLAYKSREIYLANRRHKFASF